MQAYRDCRTDLIVVLHLWQYSCGRRKLLVPGMAHVLGSWRCVVGRVDSNALKNHSSFETSRIIQPTALRHIPEDLSL